MPEDDDFNRREALQLAVSSRDNVTASPAEIVALAQEFYRFLSGYSEAEIAASAGENTTVRGADPKRSRITRESYSEVADTDKHHHGLNETAGDIRGKPIFEGEMGRFDPACKTTGLTFFEAVEAMKSGETVKRAGISGTLRLAGGLFLGREPTGVVQFMDFGAHHILATDWQIVEPE